MEAVPSRTTASGASFTLTIVNPALMAINADGGDITTLTITIAEARKTYLPLIRRRSWHLARNGKF